MWQPRGGQVLRPPPPPADVNSRTITDVMRERAKSRHVSAAALQAAIDATAHGLGDSDAPADAVPRLAAFGREGFQALCVLLEVGHTHGGSWQLFRATWQPGDERELLALASGDPLPNWAQWTAIEALGIADTPEVHAWVRERLAVETDAGLWMALASADPLAAPSIDPNFLGHPDDLDAMVDGFKLTRKLMDAPILAGIRTGEIYTEGIHSDEAIREELKNRSDTIYHPIGTCKMGSDAMAVVDSCLRVHGLEGLRVVDASIMPTLIGGNTTAPTLMIGEKAAEMIRRDASAAV